MRHLAGMTSSPDVRGALFYIIERFEEELLQEFQFAEPMYLQQKEWIFGAFGKDEYSLDLCKKHKDHKKRKKHKDWFKKIDKWIERSIKLYKVYREVKKLFDE
jgi:hypothetical protein